MKVKVTGWMLLMLFLATALMIQPSPAASASLRDEMIAKAKKEGQVVFMGDLADQLKNRLKGFTKKYPFIRFKSLEGRHGQTINRVAAEARVGKLSIDVSGMSLEDVGPLLRLNLLQKYEFPHLKNFPHGSQPSHGLYVIGQMDPIPQGVYNTKLVPPDEVPQSWEDMVDTKWKGKTIVSRSRSDVVANLAWMWRKGDKMDWERSFKYFKKVKQNEPVLGGSGIRRHVFRVAAGEFAFMWFPAIGSVSRVAVKGAPLSFIAFPKMFASYEIWTIFKNAPHPGSAWLLIDYLLSPAGQHEYTDTVNAVVPMNQKATAGKLGQWVIKLGVTLEKSELVPPDRVLEVYTEGVLKKSQKAYQDIMGY